MKFSHIVATVAAAVLMVSSLIGAAANKAAESKDGTVSSVAVRVQKAVEHGAKAAANGIERGAKAAEYGIRVGIKAAARGIERGAEATTRAAKTVAKKVEGSSGS
jgi:hypothetical protein